MRLGYDFQTDNADDIFLDGDIFIEADLGTNTVKNAERRITARYDDFILSNISCGIERYIGKKITDMTKYIITEEIKRCLGSDGLLSGNEFDVVIPAIQNIRKLPVFLKFNSPFIQGSDSFKVIVNTENQRSYK
jgi:hypothetical protein